MGFIDYVKTYKKFFIILALVTFILSFPITLSLLNQQTQQRLQSEPISQIAEEQIVPNTLRDPDQQPYTCIKSDCSERWFCNSNVITPYDGGLPITESPISRRVTCPTGSVCKQVGSRGAACFQSGGGGSDSTCSPIGDKNTCQSTSGCTWYCSGGSAQDPCTQGYCGPKYTPACPRNSCDAIRGTQYCSDAERDWYLANCQGSGGTPGGGGTTCSAGTTTSASVCNGWDIALGQDFYQYPSSNDSSPSPNAAECKYACDADNACRAYTWVPAGKPGSYEGQNTCYLKAVTEPRLQNTGIVSGYKASGTSGGGGGTTCSSPGQVCPGTNLYGSDFHNYCNNDPNLRSPRDCQIACQSDGNCRSWTFQHNISTCWLKNSIPGSNPDPNTTSGIKGSGQTASSTTTGGSCPSGGGGGGGGGVSPSVSKPPSVSPSVSVSPSLTTTVSPSVTTPVSPSPSTTIAPNEFKIALDVRLAGIGANTAAGQNANPVRPNQPIQIQVFDASGQKIKDVSGSLAFDSASKTFKGTLSLGTDLQSGPYTIKGRLNNTLWKAQSAQLTSGQTSTLPAVQLIAGDLDQNNELNLIDYNTFLSCSGTKQCAQKDKADLNIDGVVDEKDLNILLANFAKRTGD